jgi:AraC-like DNA-binding protein
LSDVLYDLRLSGAAYGRCEFGAPWRVYFPPDTDARFHFVAEGSAWLRLGSAGEGAEWVGLAAGDVVLLPRAAGHVLADTPEPAHRRSPAARRAPVAEIDALPRTVIGERVYALRAGGAGARSALCCGSVGFHAPAAHQLLALMPPMLHVRGALETDATLRALLAAMADEVRSVRVGGATLLTRLADVVVARVVRAWVESGPHDATGWLAAARDPQIGRALAAMHRRPGERWTVAALARVAQASRSAFAERFVAAVGVPPARYLARWRMQVAGDWLRTERLTVAEAAARLGYASEPAFSRAFKRATGVPPSAVRRLARSSAAAADRGSAAATIAGPGA